MRQDVEQVRETAPIGFEELLHEPLGAIRFFADDCFPCGPGALATRCDDAVAMHVNAFAECCKHCRSPLEQASDKSGVIGEELQRLVVQSGEAVADHCGGTIGKNRPEETV